MPPRKASRLSFAERERRILKAATGLFSRNGYRGTTTRAIARAAGVNEALLYRHFPTKEALYTALLKDRLATWATHELPQLEKAHSEPLPQALNRIATTLVASQQRDPSLLRMALYSSLESHRMTRTFFRQKLPLADFLERFFIARINRGEVRPLHPVLLARAFLSLVQHYVLVTTIFRAGHLYPTPEAQTLRSFVDIFIRGAGL